VGIISIVGESYLAQYKLVYSPFANVIATEIPIVQRDMKNTQFPGVSLTFYELKQLCMKMQRQKRRFNKVQSKSTGLRGHMNNIYAVGDYVFLDITFENDTKIKYDIDLVTFHIDDKKIYKATNNQSIQVTPVYTLYQNPYFQKTYRNVYVFKKFTYPNDKILKIKIEEKQISGRTLELAVDYKELLNADTF
jgi:conjugative transposon TraN protein